MDRVAVKLEQDLAPMDEGNGEKQVKSRSMNQYDHVDHIIVDHVGVCVASTLEETNGMRKAKV